MSFFALIMKKTCLTFAIFATFCALSATPAEKTVLSANVPRIKAERMPDLLKLPWDKGCKLPMNLDRHGKPVKTQRQMTLLHDGIALYLRYDEKCDLKKLEGNASESSVWKNDSLEIFFAAKNAKPYTHYSTCVWGQKAGLCSFPKNEAHFNGNWNFGEKRKIVIGKNEYTIYISIPLLYLLPGEVAPGQTIYANFFRYTPSRGMASCWNPIYAFPFSTIERAGKITLAK